MLFAVLAPVLVIWADKVATMGPSTSGLFESTIRKGAEVIVSVSVVGHAASAGRGSKNISKPKAVIKGRIRLIADLIFVISFSCNQQKRKPTPKKGRFHY
jgi:hypothetical protein